MRLTRYTCLRLALLLFAIVPALAWVIVKPVRVVIPEWGGVTCTSRVICVDDPARRAEAEALHAEAVAFVGAKVSPVPGQPRVTFCSTQACADYFGLGARSAVTVGTVGTVIGPRAWKAYYVRHEIIHYLQANELGAIGLLFKPAWFVEGMAYGLSEDPRSPLAEPFEAYRREFMGWFRSVGKAHIWAEGRRL